MEIIKTKLEGCFILKHSVYRDERGVFFETYNKKEFAQLTGLNVDFVQDNFSISKKGVLRGLHFQKEPYSQAKLIQVLKGEVLDVIVDLREKSKTFGKYLKIRIDASEGKSVFIPKGMAHGFLSLSEQVLFSYKCDSYYHPESECGVRFDDPYLSINWEYPINKMVLSEKDKTLPLHDSFTSFKKHKSK